MPTFPEASEPRPCFAHLEGEVRVPLHEVRRVCPSKASDDESVVRVPKQTAIRAPETVQLADCDEAQAEVITRDVLDCRLFVIPGPMQFRRQQISTELAAECEDMCTRFCRINFVRVCLRWFSM